MSNIIREYIFYEAKRINDTLLPNSSSQIKRLKRDLELQEKHFNDGQEFVKQAIQLYGFKLLPSTLGDGYPPRLVDPQTEEVD